MLETRIDKRTLRNSILLVYLLKSSTIITYIIIRAFWRGRYKCVCVCVAGGGAAY